MIGHRKTGTIVLYLAVLAGLSGGITAIFFQLSNLFPILKTILDPSVLKGLTATHARMMVFYALQPALTMGLGCWFVPILIGAKDMAFPRLNSLMLSFLLGGFVLNFLTFFQPHAFGWILVGLFCWGTASLLFAINMLITIINCRTIKVKRSALPIFVWGQGISAALLLPISSVLLAAVTRIYQGPVEALPFLIHQVERAFSYPMILVLIVPAFGMVFHIIGNFSTASPSGFNLVKGILSIMAGIGFLLWNHTVFEKHFLSVSYPSLLPAFLFYLLFTLCLFLLINCFEILWKQEQRFSAPIWWVVGFMVFLAVGWPAEGIVKGLQQIHSAISYAALFATFAGFYFWMGKMTGRICNEKWVKLQMIVTFMGAFFFLNLLPLGGNATALGSMFLGLSLIIFMGIMIASWRQKIILPENYWHTKMVTREWQLPSPIPTDFV